MISVLKENLCNKIIPIYTYNDETFITRIDSLAISSL